MKRLEYGVTHDLAKLTNELLAAIPALAPQLNANNEFESVFRIEGREGAVTIDMPDEVNENDVSAVVAAHDPTPPPPPPDPAAAIAAATTLEELKAALLEQIDPTVKGA